MKIWLSKNWFPFIVAVCTIITTIANIVIGLLSIGWLEWLWQLHSFIGI